MGVFALLNSAAALEAAASEAEDPESQLQAQQIAETTREQTSSEEPHRGALKALMLQAAGSLVTALSTVTAAQVGPLALEAAHSFL
ncbi:hypothetical protein [Rhodococcus sp. IEGM 1307]|uniref:hypothetical protein n=1 Tax=Rhodococcus sp. IEGM 1307 TaxID=3047091 RepID=UPI0013C0C2E1|nr:hypothetical protein [Rhodococcus sp. IEGM 1307]MDI9980030.1 hypothetical protein [Rhodococcus sp. IEGM 1307]NDV08684.1 hypothetical protein [Rhodococcus sp. IEGM 248]